MYEREAAAEGRFARALTAAVLIQQGVLPGAVDVVRDAAVGQHLPPHGPAADDEEVVAAGQELLALDRRDLPASETGRQRVRQRVRLRERERESERERPFSRSSRCTRRSCGCRSPPSPLGWCRARSRRGKEVAWPASPGGASSSRRPSARAWLLAAGYVRTALTTGFPPYRGVVWRRWRESALDDSCGPSLMASSPNSQYFLERWKCRAKWGAPNDALLVSRITDIYWYVYNVTISLRHTVPQARVH